ncbi:Phytanoyl-CoA dioxygenase family protein [Sulfidibacter corallicola]|uniref:Phytanoyl-CoA dioxygenase family protein n=1 Tax=Sulfidibacter corallicola TaxID=2818388 RepID=A0A8A4TFS2_SULCO|nr:phytanoyl-CoA dioxygenase family protein [Sulfidibacter corallicola]QTD48929.1 phytanoyl-CoA dioxygenase family protein [Sulfidibacter corallicola]
MTTFPSFEFEGPCNPELSAGQLTRFWEMGYGSHPLLLEGGELEGLRTKFEDILVDAFGLDSQTLATTLTIEKYVLEMTLSASHSDYLSDSQIYGKIVGIGAQLFGLEPEDVVAGWRIFLKKPGFKETPFHQDALFRPPPYDSISFWIPLDGASERNGCLYYIDRSHERGLLPHREIDGQQTIEAIGFEEARACPLPPGAVSFHHCMTIHGAAPNRDTKSRRCFGIVCSPGRSTGTV